MSSSTESDDGLDSDFEEVEEEKEDQQEEERMAIPRSNGDHVNRDWSRDINLCRLEF